MISFTDHYNAIFIDRLPSNIKIGNDSWKRFRKIILFFVSPSFTTKMTSTTTTTTATTTSVFIKNTKNNHSSASEWWEFTKNCFRENAKMLSKNFNFKREFPFFY